MLYEQYIKLIEQKLIDGLFEQIIVTRHEPCITLGTNSIENEIIQKTNLPVVKSNRGGGATYHDLGQLVLYPIIDLNQRKLNISDCVAILERWGIDAFAQFGIVAKKGIQPGLWVSSSKVAFIGLAVKRGFALHGISFNLQNCDLSGFSSIIPCKSFEKIGKCDIDFESMLSALKASNPFDIQINVLD